MFYKKIVTLTNIFLIILSALAVLKCIFIGFDIDEGYAIAQAYRLVLGDRMFAEMWEPHQMSAFGSSVFLFPYLLITGGDTTGCVLYLRLIGTVIHLLIGYGFFRYSRKKFSFTVSLLITLIHLNFLPKWLTMPEFEIMVYWSTCIIFLALLTWLEKQRKRYLVVSGIAFFITLMCYPTMVLLYPIYLIALWKLSQNTRKEKILSLLWFTLPIALMGISFLLYLFSYMSVPEFMENLSLVMADESHSNSLAYRFTGYFKEISEFVIQLAIHLALASPVTVFLWKFTPIKGHVKVNGKSVLLIIQLLLTISFLCVNHIWCSFLGDANQFYLYFRFLLVAILGIALSTLFKEKSKSYLWFGIIPGFMAVFSSALITNMSFEIALARIYIAVMATCFLVAGVLKEKYSESQLIQVISFGTAVVFLLGLLVCKLLLVRVTGCIPISVKMHMGMVNHGPVAGVLVKDELADKFNRDFAAITDYTDSTDRLLYFGCENIYYLGTEAKPATPSVQGTAVFNNQYIEYFEKHPDKTPNVVIIDKSFFTNPYYNYQEQNQIVLDWIDKEFKNAEMVETDYLKILRK